MLYNDTDNPNPHWTKRSPLPIRNPKCRGKVWELECIYCGAHKNLLASQRNADKSKCECRNDGRTKIFLSFQGRSRTIKEWKKLFPFIDKAAVGSRNSMRNLGNSGWANATDAQIIFGKRGTPEDFNAIEKAEADRRGVENELRDLVGHILQGWENATKTIIEERILPFMLKANSTAALPAEILAGGEYEVLRINTIQESLDAGVSVQEVIETLESESWATPEAKAQALIAFIPVDMSTNVLTGLEIMALFSTISQFDLRK